MVNINHDREAAFEKELYLSAGRSAKNVPFTQISNGILYDTSIRPEDVRLLAFLLSKINWKVNVAFLCQLQGCTRNTLYASIKRLIARGYITRQRISTRHGYRYHYEFHQTPEPVTGAAEPTQDKDQDNQRKYDNCTILTKDSGEKTKSENDSHKDKKNRRKYGNCPIVTNGEPSPKKRVSGQGQGKVVGAGNGKNPRKSLDTPQVTEVEPSPKNWDWAPEAQSQNLVLGSDPYKMFKDKSLHKKEGEEPSPKIWDTYVILKVRNTGKTEDKGKIHFFRKTETDPAGNEGNMATTINDPVAQAFICFFDDPEWYEEAADQWVRLRRTRFIKPVTIRQVEHALAGRRIKQPPHLFLADFEEWFRDNVTGPLETREYDLQMALDDDAATLQCAIQGAQGHLNRILEGKPGMTTEEISEDILVWVRSGLPSNLAIYAFVMHENKALSPELAAALKSHILEQCAYGTFWRYFIQHPEVLVACGTSVEEIQERTDRYIAKLRHDIEQLSNKEMETAAV